MNSSLKSYIINYVNTKAKEVLPQGKAYSIALIIAKDTEIDENLSVKLDHNIVHAVEMPIPTQNKFSAFCDDSMEELDPDNFHFFGFGSL